MIKENADQGIEKIKHYSAKDNFQNVERQPMDWVKIFANHILDRAFLVAQIVMKHLQCRRPEFDP